MLEITVARPFNRILSPNALPIPFAPGTHTVSDEIAQHWYVKAHLADANDPVATERRATVAALDLEAHGRSVGSALLEAANARHTAELAARTAEAVEMVTLANERSDAATARADAAEVALRERAAS